MKGYRLQVVGYSFLLFVLLSTVHCTLYPAFAVDEIGQARIHPASPLYFLKTIRESLELKFAGTPRVRMIRELEFATRRLREVKSLITGNHQDLIEPTLERYWYYLSKLPDKDLTDKELVLRIKESLIIHLEILQKVYIQTTNVRAKMAIRSAINKMLGRAEVPDYVRQTGCKFLAKEASSSALNDVEKAVLKNRAQNCFAFFDIP